MKRLLLMRHAKSSWDDAATLDHDRPLAPRGERDAPRIGARLAERGIRPSLLLSSTAARALRTAEIVAAELGVPPERLRLDSALYLAAPTAILGVLATAGDEHDCVMVFGHNPGFTDLAKLLLPDLPVDDLPTAAVVAVDFPIARWADAARAHGTLAFYDYPKNPQSP